MADVPEPVASVAVLMHAATMARFAGSMERPCMHRTSLCPDRCSHPRKWAVFDTTVPYRTYEKPGQYGDPEANQFHLQLDPPESDVAHGPGTHDLAASLAVGDSVELEWVHEYVTTAGGSKYPRRRVLVLRRA
jgi:hypothetical protein